MSKTFSQLLIDTLHSDIEPNAVDVNTESPYTAIKLLLINQTLLTTNANAIVKSLSFAHIANATVQTDAIVNNRVQFDEEFIAITRIESSNIVFKIESLIDKTLRFANVAINGICNKCPYSIQQQNGALIVTLTTTDIRQVASLPAKLTFVIS